MNSACPHCLGKMPTKALVLSAAGMVRHVDCKRCSRRLSVSSFCKLAFVGVTLLTLSVCFAYSQQQRNELPFLALVPVLAISTLLLRRWASFRLVWRPSAWLLAWHFTAFGLLLCALIYAPQF